MMTHGHNASVNVRRMYKLAMRIIRWSPAPIRVLYTRAVRKWRVSHLSVADKMSVGQR